MARQRSHSVEFKRQVAQEFIAGETLYALAKRYDAWLMTDDAHGLGVIGAGRGSSFAFTAPVDVPLQMGTLSKAIGGYGGYLCASDAVIDLIHNRARTFIYATGLPPAMVAAAIAALDLIEHEPRYAALPLAKAKCFTRLAGLPEAQSPIVPLIVGDAPLAMEMCERALELGVFAQAIRPPTVPVGTARLRLSVMATHSKAELRDAAHALGHAALQAGFRPTEAVPIAAAQETGSFAAARAA